MLSETNHPKIIVSTISFPHSGEILILHCSTKLSFDGESVEVASRGKIVTVAKDPMEGHKKVVHL